MNILITGATGNIGRTVVSHLFAQATLQTPHKTTPHTIIAGVRNADKARQTFTDQPDLQFVHFDFEDATTFDAALSNINRIFLLRPPHISDIETHFVPLMEAIQRHNIQEVVFLSVQGAEKSKAIPHHKIEKLIQRYGLHYIFIRPSYFMQNLTTTLLQDIQKHQKIVLPAGKAQFNWIDIEDIGEVGALLLNHFETYANKAFEITGSENRNFAQVVAEINETLGTSLVYKPVNPIKFYRIKKRAGLEKGFILVMILLHFLPRFQKDPHISADYKQLTGKDPTNMRTFILREQAKLVSCQALSDSAGRSYVGVLQGEQLGK